MPQSIHPVRVGIRTLPGLVHLHETSRIGEVILIQSRLYLLQQQVVVPHLRPDKVMCGTKGNTCIGINIDVLLDTFLFKS